VPQIELPRFGPFSLPPARSLAVASDAEGERLVVVARIYPAIAWIARAAGTLARNPWLTGGVVGDAGRRLEVAWDRGHWMLRTPGEAWPQAAEGGPRGPALARLSLDRPLGALPPADYRLVRTGRHLDLLTDGAGPDGLVEPGRGALIHAERSPAGWRATAVLGPGQGSLQGLPSAVGFARPGVEPPKLPFERLYRLLGIDRRRAEHDGWRLVASDRLALERGRALATEVGRLSESGARQRFVVDLDVVREVTRELEAGLEGLPLRSIPEVRRWHGASLLLYELGAYDRWSLEVGEDGSTVRSRLWRPE
jgi:hypothetical protein